MGLDAQNAVNAYWSVLPEHLVTKLREMVSMILFLLPIRKRASSFKALEIGL